MSKEKNTSLENSEMHMPVSFTEANHSRLGPVLGVLVVILVLILSGLYLWGATLSKQLPQKEVSVQFPNNEPETTRAVADTQILTTTSPSDELSAIETDLGATNLDSLDSDLDVASRELDGAL
jgi:hypothetical protein